MLKLDRYAVPGSEFFRWLKLFPPGAIFDLKIDINHLLKIDIDRLDYWNGKKAPVYRITGTVTW